MKFSDLDLHPKLFAGIQKNEFTELTSIQESSFNLILNNDDIAGLSQTGTGKTAAFLLPIMERILRSQDDADKDLRTEAPEDKKDNLRSYPGWKSNSYILVLVPTRELAEQVFTCVKKFGGDAGLKSAVIYGGIPYDKQKDALSKGVQFVIATPGRLMDLYREKVIDFHQVKAIIFDEADRMFDMGFKEDMQYILSRVPRTRQFLVFSATLNFDVLNVAYEFGASPIELNVSKDETKAENVTDELFHLSASEKPQYLLSLLKKHSPRQAIIFSNFKNSVTRIAGFLTANGMSAQGISSLLTQAQRNRIMEDFRKEGGCTILVGTDVAARGLDVKNVDMVINYELPDNAENYVHRIGRTGRAGEKGIAYSLSGDRDVEALQRIHEYLGDKISTGWLEDSELLTDFKEMSRETPFDRMKKNHQKRKSAGAKEERRPARRSDYKRSGGRRNGKYDGKPSERKYSKSESSEYTNSLEPRKNFKKKKTSDSAKKTRSKKMYSKKSKSISSSVEKRVGGKGVTRKKMEPPSSVMGFIKKLFG